MKRAFFMMRYKASDCTSTPEAICCYPLVGHDNSKHERRHSGNAENATSATRQSREGRREKQILEFANFTTSMAVI